MTREKDEPCGDFTPDTSDPVKCGRCGWYTCDTKPMTTPAPLSQADYCQCGHLNRLHDQTGGCAVNDCMCGNEDRPHATFPAPLSQAEAIKQDKDHGAELAAAPTIPDVAESVAASDPIVGHTTFRDGHHEPLRQSEAKSIMDAIDKADALRAQQMPSEQSAIDAMFSAWQRLKEFGWNDAIYCPKDGRAFRVIESGSTGIHDAHYEGQWPTGSWWIHDDGDLYPSRPVLWKPLAEEEAATKVSSSTAASPALKENSHIGQAEAIWQLKSKLEIATLGMVANAQRVKDLEAELAVLRSAATRSAPEQGAPKA